MSGQQTVNHVGDEEHQHTVEEQRSLQHPHLPSSLVGVSDQSDGNAILHASLDAAAAVAAGVDPAAAVQTEHAGQPDKEELQQDHVHQEAGQEEQPQQEDQQQHQHDQPEEHVAQDYTQADQDGQNAAANFFAQNYQEYEFPATSAGLSDSNTATSPTFPFHPHPHPQHPHLGVEALGQAAAAAASQHGRVPVPSVNIPEGDGGNSYIDTTNGGDQSMDLTMTTTGGDTTSASLEQQDSQSGKARSSLGLPGKKDTPYSRSPDMRNSHKLAERKRRKEMKDLFDELRDEIPVERGPKTSKWEILTKAVDHVRALRKERDEFAAELHVLRGGDPQGQPMHEEEVQPPAPAPEDQVDGQDDYAKYEQQQVASQQQVEAAAAAANQFSAQEYAQHGQEEHNSHQEEYKPSEEAGQEAAQEPVAQEQDWGAIAAQAQAQVEAQAAQ